MIRDSLGSFGREMSDTELGGALAAFVSGADISPVDIAPRGRIGRSLRYPWWWARIRRRRTDEYAALLAWNNLVKTRGSTTGLALEVAYSAWPWLPFDITDLLPLVANAEGLSAIHCVTAPPQPTAEWLWPLDLAHFDDPESRLLVELIDTLHRRDFVAPLLASRAVEPIELLVIPGSLGTALARLAASPGLPRVLAVVVLGGHRDVPQPVAAAEVLRNAARADAVCVASTLGAEGPFLDRFLVELSHDRDLDVAFQTATRAQKLDPPLLVAAEGAFARAHLTQWTKQVANRLARIAPVELPSTRLFSSTRTDVVARELLANLPSFAFVSEGGDATDVANLGREARQRPVAPDRRERRVQAELFDEAEKDQKPIEKAPLHPGHMYRLEVWIGARTGGALAAPVAFPDDALPHPDQWHTLSVVLMAPGVLEQAKTRTLRLPPGGESDRVSFRLPIDRNCMKLDARVTILHDNRILQTLRLEAAVGQGESVPLALGIEAVVRRDLDAAMGRRPFDAALLFNELGGDSSMSVFAGDRASLVPLHDVGDIIADIGRILEDATNRPDRYGPPPNKATTELLTDLARKGSLFRRALLRMPHVEEDLAKSRRLQIIAAKPESVLPVEACYDPPPPDQGAPICPQWSAALASRATESSCPDACPTDKRKVVCPIGFWSTNRVIERHVYRKADAANLGANDFALQSEPSSGRARLTVQGGGVCGAATEARAVDAFAVEAAFETANELVPQTPEVTSWAAWKADIGARNPRLLLLLAHTGEERGLATLAIADDTALLTEVDERFVGKGAGQGPLVLLLGCSTAVQKPVFESFITQFQLGGAAIVMGTLCEILGQHAAPIAAAIVTHLAAASRQPDGEPFGDRMTKMRRELVAAGLPIALTVIAFGDADWVI